jgi:regulator of RNase E activity RraA
VPNISNKVGFRVCSPWPRPEAEVLAAFGHAASTQVADSMSRIGAMDMGIKPIWPSPRIIGPALTVCCHSGDNLMLHQAIALALPGDILVVNTQGNITNSPFGGLMASSAMKMGVKGVIVDGTVRDVESIQALALPVYARGLCPNGCYKDGSGEVGTVIACGGVAIRPGDIIVADRDGIAVVPLFDAAEVAKLSIAKVQSEEKREAAINSGVVTPPEIDEQLRRLNIIS